jgi:hypothetical protein
MSRCSSACSERTSEARRPAEAHAHEAPARRARPDKDDEAYLEFIRRQGCCCGCGARPPSDPHHRPGAGEGARSHDHDAIPMRRSPCHDDVDAFRGRFAVWLEQAKQLGVRAMELRQEWHSAMVAKYRALYLTETPVARDTEDVF